MIDGESSTQLVRVESDLSKWLKQHVSEIAEDRISNLPDDLIADKILSRFLDTRFVISTCIISKRWQHLWKYVPCLLFNDKSYCKAAEESFLDVGFSDQAFLEFYNGVNITLGQYQLEYMNKFYLDANYETRFASLVESWIDFAVGRYVKDFTLYLRHLGNDDTFSIESQSFYMNSHLTTLDVRYCLFDPHVGITWNNLKVLTISYSRLEEDLIPKIVSGSPLLETLTLRCYHGSLIDITSPSVNNLILLGYEADELVNFVQINAPHITFLKIVDCLWISAIVFRNFSYLLKAYLNFDFPHYYKRFRKRDEEIVLGDVITSLQNVNEVKVGINCHPTIRRLTSKGFVLPSNVVCEGGSLIYHADFDLDVEGSDSK
uniref:F-box/LRR-repeat protein 25-like n=1 Tax=Erigeron canadensis TaxID=72917 RepID=UPI001CB9AE74|nr:F-box/LRR-repeat protein 25-like [Erigeron canadensis]